jgi:hypothetical protein
MAPALELPSNNLFVGDNATSSKMGSAGNPEQTLDDTQKKDLEFVLLCIEQGKKHLAEREKDWDKADQYYDAKQWPNSRPKWRASPVANVCRPTIETILPILTDTSPGFSFSGRNPDDFDFANTMTDVNKNWWETENMDYKIPVWIKDALMYPVGILKVIWNDDLKAGLGDVDVSVVDPKAILVRKGTLDFDQTCPWVVHLMSKTVGDLKRAFPELAQIIRADGSGKELDQEYGSNKNKAYSGDIIPVAITTQKTTLRNLTDVEKHSDVSEDVLIAECWATDETIEDYQDKEETPKKDDNGQLVLGEDGKPVIESAIVNKQRYKNPNGKVITIIPSQRILLQSKPSPRDDGRKPFVRLVDHIRGRKFYGDGEINESVIKVQDLLNSVLAVIMDHAKLMNNSGWVIDQSTGIDPQMISNGVGQILIKTGPGTVERLTPPEIPSQLFRLYTVLFQLADYETGVHDETRGRKPTGVTANSAIQTLQEASQTRIRLKDRNLECSLTQLGYLVIATMLQNYRLPRIVKITGQGANPQFYEIFIDKTAEGYVYHQQKYNTVEELNPDGSTTTRYVPENQWTVSKPSRGLFDISVTSGTSLPYAKDKRASLALTLFDKKLIDQKEVLTAVDWPRKEEVMQRMDKSAQDAASAQQAQAPAMPGAPAPTAPTA